MKESLKIRKTIFTLLLLATGVAAMSQTQVAMRPLAAENKVAILPINYAGEGNDRKHFEMRYRLQHIAFEYLKGEAMELKFQDPAETNAQLLKRGIHESNIREFTPKELAAILQVEYVLTGMVTQDFTGESSVSHSHRREHYRRGREHRETNRYSRTVLQLNTSIGLDVYNDNGENIYSKSRRSILTDADAYKNGIHYLLKRSPLFKR